MSVQSINLLPDSRLKRYAEKSHKRTAVVAMVSVVGVCAGILVIGFLVVSAQSLRINALTKSITEKSAEIREMKDVNEILGTQQRLSSLGKLYKERIKLSGFFQVLDKIAPPDLAVRNLTLGEENVITIGGVAKDYATASKLASAMEQSGVTVNISNTKDPQPDFTNVKLSGLSADTTTGLVQFTISAVVSPGVINGQ